MGSTHSTVAQNFNRIEHLSNIGTAVDNNGAAVADYNGDGFLDVFVVTRQENYSDGLDINSYLFRNNGDASFTNVIDEVGITNNYNYSNVSSEFETGLNMAASWGDFNNDGFPDLLLLNYQHLKLYQNINGTHFQDVTLSANLPYASLDYYVGATWADINKDGYLDLFLAMWQEGSFNQLFLNNGNGTFSDITSVSGIENINTQLDEYEGYTWMLMPVDFNEDNYIDFYAANDFKARNRLYVNQQNGLFLDETESYGLWDMGSFAMGIAQGDYNMDGNFDLYVADINESSLFKNLGNQTFEQNASEKGVQWSDWAWGTRFADFDNDSDEDLIIVNGYNFPEHQIYYQNQFAQRGNNFLDKTSEVKLTQKSNNNGLAVFDYDNDGDLEILITNKDEKLHFYENHTITGTVPMDKNWLQLKLVGTASNRDAIGARVEIITNKGSQYRFHTGSALYAQNLIPLHFGLGESTMVDYIKILWPSDNISEYSNLSANEIYEITENDGIKVITKPVQKIFGCTDPNSCSYNPLANSDDGSCQYLAVSQINGAASSAYLSEETYSYEFKETLEYIWDVENGEIVTGQGTNSVQVKWGIHGTGRVSLIVVEQCLSEELVLNVSIRSDHAAGVSFARLWNEVLLEAIRRDYARPTVHARNLFHSAVAMYDSWAMYNLDSTSTYLLGKTVGNYKSGFPEFSTSVEESEAINSTLSYAMYRLLSHRFKNSPNSELTLLLFDELMSNLGYDISLTSTDLSSGDPASLGNYIAEEIINYGNTDNAEESTGYGNAFYEPVNEPLAPIFPGNPSISDPNRWQPLELSRYIDQAGNLIDATIPEFLSPEWGSVTPFSLNQNDLTIFERNGNSYFVYHTPQAPPQINTNSIDEESGLYKWNFSMVSVWGAHLDPYDGVFLDISPASLGNISLESIPVDYALFKDFYDYQNGGDISTGHSVNPVTGQPYVPQIVPRGDYARILAEFWADGPDSETPPGHWFTLLNYVADHPLFQKKFEGVGEVMDDLEWYVKAYFLLGGAMHDAAISAWGIKGWFDYIRPISAIRYMADKGQSTDPNDLNYNVAGIPLVENYIELVREGDPLALNKPENIGKIKLYTWRGHNEIINPDTDQAGVGWILAENWWPYQRPSFVTPPFAGFVSGHSTYSRAAAELMTRLTGTAYFPGGMGEFVAKKNEFLVFEEGPSQDVILQWATYQDASDQCSLSRIWGGIHPPADDIPGRLIGYKIGNEAFDFGVQYFQPELITGLESEIGNSVSVYPNPVKSGQNITVTGNYQKEEIRLYNLQGKELKVNSLSSLDSTSIQVPYVPAGIYILSIKNNVIKIIIAD